MTLGIFITSIDNSKKSQTWTLGCHFLKLHLCTYVSSYLLCMCECSHMCHGMSMWRSDDSSWGLALPFCHVGSRVLIQTARLGEEQASLRDGSSHQSKTELHFFKNDIFCVCWEWNMYGWHSVCVLFPLPCQSQELNSGHQASTFEVLLFVQHTGNVSQW